MSTSHFPATELCAKSSPGYSGLFQGQKDTEDQGHQEPEASTSGVCEQACQAPIWWESVYRTNGRPCRETVPFPTVQTAGPQRGSSAPLEWRWQLITDVNKQNKRRIRVPYSHNTSQCLSKLLNPRKRKVKNRSYKIRDYINTIRRHSLNFLFPTNACHSSGEAQGTAGASAKGRVLSTTAPSTLLLLS